MDLAMYLLLEDTFHWAYGFVILAVDSRRIKKEYPRQKVDKKLTQIEIVPLWCLSKRSILTT